MSRRVLVTGASRGIGRAIAYQLASDGFDVSVHCRSGRAEADAIVADIQANKGSARVLQFDVRDRAACRTSGRGRALEQDPRTQGEGGRFLHRRPVGVQHRAGHGYEDDDDLSARSARGVVDRSAGTAIASRRRAPRVESGSRDVRRAFFNT